MQTVIFSQTIAPVIQSDRVKRAKSRGDSGKDASFSKQRRQEKDASSGSESPPREEAEIPPAVVVSTKIAAGGGSPIHPQTEKSLLSGKKLIDVRV